MTSSAASGPGHHAQLWQESDLRPVFRFAPSPNGYLHLGHAYSALRNSELARQHDGRFLLRLEDIDLDRCRPDYEQAVFEDLAWLGLSWPEPVRKQSEHFDDYRAALAKRGEVDRTALREAIDKYDLLDVTAAEAGLGMGDA